MIGGKRENCRKISPEKLVSTTGVAADGVPQTTVSVTETESATATHHPAHPPAAAGPAAARAKVHVSCWQAATATMGVAAVVVHRAAQAGASGRIKAAAVAAAAAVAVVEAAILAAAVIAAAQVLLAASDIPGLFAGEAVIAPQHRHHPLQPQQERQAQSAHVAAAVAAVAAVVAVAGAVEAAAAVAGRSQMRRPAALAAVKDAAQTRGRRERCRLASAEVAPPPGPNSETGIVGTSKDGLAGRGHEVVVGLTGVVHGAGPVAGPAAGLGAGAVIGAVTGAVPRMEEAAGVAAAVALAIEAVAAAGFPAAAKAPGAEAVPASVPVTEPGQPLHPRVHSADSDAH